MRRFRFVAFLALLAAGAALGGCSIMPVTGPAGEAVLSGQEDPGSLPYAVVKVTPEVEGVLAANAPRLGAMFRDSRPPKGITFGVNDILSVTIFEAAAGGLFIPSEAGVRPGNFVNLPNQPVDTSGNITIPYAGQIRAAGRTPDQVQQEIVNALKNRAIEPQAVVAIVTQNSNLISVLGDVNNPSRFPANTNAEHILDSITRAGGPKSQAYDEWVMLERDGKRDIVPFGALLYEAAANNIWTHPNDTIFLYNEPQTYTAFGAFGSQGSTVPAAGTIQFWWLAAFAVRGYGQSWRFERYTRRTEVCLSLSRRNPRCGNAAWDRLLKIQRADHSGCLQHRPARSGRVFLDDEIPDAEQRRHLRSQRDDRTGLKSYGSSSVMIVGTVNDPIVAAQNAYALRATIRAQ